MNPSGGIWYAVYWRPQAPILQAGSPIYQATFDGNSGIARRGWVGRPGKRCEAAHLHALGRRVPHNLACLPLWNVANENAKTKSLPPLLCPQIRVSYHLPPESALTYRASSLAEQNPPSYAPMMHILGVFTFSLLTLASAQVSTSKFTNTWLANYFVGLTYQISWTVGDDRPVSLTISNSTWSQDLACKFDASSKKAGGH